MTKKEQEDHFDKLVQKFRGTMTNKGSDYANEDRLSNFKLAGAIAGLTAQQNCLSLIATKVARLGVLYEAGTPPKNEAILDSIEDLAIYGILLHMIEIDLSSKNSKTYGQLFI